MLRSITQGVTVSDISISYHTQTHRTTGNDTGPTSRLGDGHEYCREVEAQLQARVECLTRELEETTARRDESRGLLLAALRGGC